MHTQQLQPSAHLREVAVIDRAPAPVPRRGSVIHEPFPLNIIAIETITAIHSKDSGAPFELEFFLFY